MQRVSFQLIEALKKRTNVILQTETIHSGLNGNVQIQTARFLLKTLFTLKRKTESFNADVILFSSMVTASLAPFLKKRFDVPLVTINHGEDVIKPFKPYQLYVPRIFKALDGVISVSPATRQQCIARGMEPEKGIALPNGVDTERFTFPDKEESCQKLEEEFGIPLSEKKMLLTVGRFMKRKGHAWFIENVLPEISNDVVYVTIGTGPELQKVKDEVKKSGMRDKIFILGRQSDEVLKQAYAAADLFIMPNIPVESDMEGFGIVMIEANLAKTPVIASDLEGIKDVITDGVNGYKIPALEAVTFSSKIDETLSGDLNLLSTRSRKHVQKQFDWTQVTERYIEFIKQTVESYTRKS